MPDLVSSHQAGRPRMRLPRNGSGYWYKLELVISIWKYTPAIGFWRFRGTEAGRDLWCRPECHPRHIRSAKTAIGVRQNRPMRWISRLWKGPSTVLFHVPMRSVASGEGRAAKWGAEERC